MTLVHIRFYDFGSFRVDAVERLLLRDGQVVPVTAKVFEILLILVRHRGHLLEKERLMKEVWPESYVEEGNLTRNISTLRKALGEKPDEHRFIETFHRRGYRFVADVQELGDEDGGSVLEEQMRTRLLVEEEWVAAPSEDARDRSAVKTWRPVTRVLLLSSVLFLFAAGSVWLILALRHPRPSSVRMRVVPFASSSSLQEEPAFSPDGNEIAFVWAGERSDNLDIYVKLIKAGAPLRLTSDPGSDHSPTFSPDGNYVAFTRVFHGTRRQTIYLIPALGGAERALAEVVIGAPTQLSWTPDGKYLAVSDKESLDDPFAIFLLSVETGEKRRLTSPPAGLAGDGRPAFSPDGQTLAFVRSGIGGTPEEIYLMSTTGGEPRRLTFDNTPLNTVAWASDGRSLVFSSGRVNVSAGLWRIPVEGGEPVWVSEAGLDATYPTVSRRGNLLAYTHESKDLNIWRVEVPQTGGPPPKPTKLISSTQSEYQPQYSPDGSRIAFTSGRSGTPEIWVCDADGSNPLQLTNVQGSDTGSARWSPDGKRLAFYSFVDGVAKIFTINANGGAPRRLTSGDSRDNAPSWSKDGRWIYYAAQHQEHSEVWKVPADGGEASPVVVPGGNPFPSPDGRSIYYATNNPDGVWRVSAEGGTGSPVLALPSFGRWYDWWEVADRGIFFLNMRETPCAIDFYDFTTKAVRKIVEVQGPHTWGEGLSVSPDGRYVIYTQRDQFAHDIMLLENFR